MSLTAPARNDVPAAERWNAESVFSTPEAWETAFVQVQAQLGEAAAYTGTLTSPDGLVAWFGYVEGLEATFGLLTGSLAP